MRITILSPHRDDAAFSVGLAIGSWLEAGHEIEVINCFTRSQYGPFAGFERLSESEREARITFLRRQEDVYWIKHYARDITLTDLDLFDAPERLGCNLNEVCRTPVRPKDEAITAIRSTLNNSASQAVLLPLGIGGHVDHLTARLAGEKEWARIRPVAFYEDLPYASRPGAANEITNLVHASNISLQAAFVGPANDIWTGDTKYSLVQNYSSQVDSTTLMEIAQFSKRYGGRERLWVSKAWHKAGLGD